VDLEAVRKRRPGPKERAGVSIGQEYLRKDVTFKGSTSVEGGLP